MELKIFDLNDGFLRKKSFINVENFSYPLMIIVPSHLAKSYERFRGLSLNLAKIVTFVNILSALNKVVMSQFVSKNW